MRKIAYVSLSSLAMVGAMTSQAWAPKLGALTPNVGTLTPNVGTLTPNVGALTPNIGALTPNVGALTPNVGALSPNVGALTPPTHIDVPNVAGLADNYGQLPNFRNYDAANAPLGGFDAPSLNYQNLAPELNYGALQPEAPNAPMGRLPPAYDVVPNNPAAVAPTNQAAALPNRPNYAALPPEAPNAPMGRLPDRPLPIAYGELPSPPPVRPQEFKPAEELAKLVDVPLDHPGVANALDNTITNNVGVPTPQPRTPVVNLRQIPNVRNLPSPQAVAGPPPRIPPKSYWQSLSTAQKRVIVGTGAVVGTTVTLVAIGIAMPTIIEAVTGEDIANTGDPELDRLINDLTPDQSQN